MRQGSTGTTPDSAIPSASIDEALDRILASDGFTSSERRRGLLRYVVGQACADRADGLTARAIAVATLGRDADFDPQTDPIVRLEISRLRRDLDKYYRTEGQNDPLRIIIPKGQYRPVFEPREAPPAPLPRIPARLNKRRLFPVAALLLGLGLAVTFWILKPFEKGDASPPPQQTGPAVLVQPFEALGAGDNSQLLAIGLTNELIVQLLQFDGLEVYSGVAAQLGRTILPPAAAGGAAFTVDGSVARDADRVRITARLTERATNRVVWSERFDRALTTAGIFEIETALSAGIAARLAQPYGIINTAASRDADWGRPATLFAYDCVQRAFLFRRTTSPDDYERVRLCLDESIRRDPGYADAWAMLAFAHLDATRFSMGAPVERESALAASLSAAQQAVALAPERVRSLQALAVSRFMLGDYDEAERIQRRAIALNPNDPESRAQLATRLMVRGRPAEGAQMMQEAIDHSVAPLPWYFAVLAFALHLEDEPARALKAAEAGRDFCCGLGHAALAIAAAAAGHPERAKQALDVAVRQAPALATDPVAFWKGFGATESIADRFNQGLVKAGLEIDS
ncbi:MAG: Wzy polymerase domain-containing protein [Pseudomonadota bacterium]